MATEVDTVATRIGAIGHKDSGAAVTYSMHQPTEPNSSARKPRVGENLVHGAGTLVGATLRAPGDFTLALAQGAHNMPRLWNDRTVREQNEIKGIGSGIAVGCKVSFLSCIVPRVIRHDRQSDASRNLYSGRTTVLRAFLHNRMKALGTEG